MERRYRETDSAWSREEMERFQNNRPCGTCGGYRLKPEALAVKIAGLHVGQVVQMSIREALPGSNGSRPPDQPEERNRPGDPEGNPRTAWIPVNVGLDYLTLSAQCRHAVGRGIAAHPAGQPDRLGLTGVLYVLDEPSIGLHQRDNDRLLTTLKNLRDAGQYGAGGRT
jgi:excinuclease ABC subunit A